ncbi:hypothetical protein NM688_g9201 [Phlebia brevispora]|uniref:Uncharacterized protein n=1 Tax=Phlebia brevispora TaxID=194682 RepID=A0ACC1RLT8_9APHY|nr:hypothetical protein NM688_g9201 [Phlebia brevispora]
MAQNFKDIRTKGIEVLTEMSTELAKLGSSETTASSNAYTAACKDIENKELTAEFVSSAANKLAESRKEILSGISKGNAKICKNVAA